MDDQKPVDFLHVLREGMAVLISTVILGLAAWTIGQTFLGARSENVEAYNREKDVMLYVVSLFGTVTGYYLGRVPAEVNARRAEKAASAAQQQLSVSQEKLGAATATASTAREEKTRISKRLNQSTGELQNVSAAIGRLRGERAGHGDRGGFGSPRPAMGIRADDSRVEESRAEYPSADAAGDAELREAKRRIDALLARMSEED